MAMVKWLPAIGIEYAYSLAYLVPMFIAFFLYWAIIGFIAGVLLAGILETMKWAQRSVAGYRRQSAPPA